MTNSRIIIKYQFVHSLIKRGRKLSAETFFSNILMNLKMLTPVKPIDLFYKALLTLKPEISLRRLQVGSVSYNVAISTPESKLIFYSIKLLFDAARDSRGAVTVDRLCNLLIMIYLAIKNVAFTKKMNWYRVASSNRGFLRRIKRR